MRLQFVCIPERKRKMADQDSIQPQQQQQPHIQFGDEIKPVKSNAAPPYTAVLRDSKVSQRITSHDLEEKAVRLANTDLNTKKKQTYTGWMLLWLAYQSTGVIYGDIGTSPLYVYSSTFTSNPSYEDLVGALSIIIWSLTLMVSIKYVFIVLAADDDGEGGTFALYSLLARYAHIVKQDPNTSGTVKMERYLTNEMKSTNKNVRTFIERSMVCRVVLKFLGVLGVSMVMSDGVLTPAQSVLGAIQGLKVAQPNISTSTIVGVTCAILIVLFAIQPFGTSKIATSFAPIVIIWLLFNMCSGIYNLAVFDASVLKAFSPSFAFSYLIRNKEDGWRSLGGLLLAFTGVEALFADLGAFSKRAVQISWLAFTYPCLLLAYIGQAAYISRDATGTAYTNPFFNTVPPGTFYFSLVIAVLAAIVASQAMITASFQLLSQVMRLSYFPHIKTVHTSKLFHGQVYMPLANWMLMIGTVVVTAVYSDTTRLGNAYGVCVIIVTFITTCMVTLVSIIIWRHNILLVLPIFLIFAALDGVYLSSALTKVPTGAWFTLLLAAILSCVFILWRYGKEQQWTSESLSLIPASALVTPSSSTSKINLTQKFGSHPVTLTPGIGIFFDKVGAHMPIVFTQFILKFNAMPSLLIFLHFRPLSVPSIPDAERWVIQRVPGLPSCYRVTVRHGYTDDVVTPSMGTTIIEQLILFITGDYNPVTGQTSSAEHTEEVRRELEELDRARERGCVYVLGKEQMKIREGTNFFRRAILWLFLFLRENSRGKMADVNLEVNEMVEVGFVKEI
ncbi:potassium transporter protein [Rutstroemia sp. NJR-2017a BVV2]|nr:potassium transporter protein [Rutstroemia sp. NJR-2017a BVV2]